MKPRTGFLIYPFFAAVTTTVVGFALIRIAPLAVADESSEPGIHFFETNIRPLLAERCYSCHSQRAGKQEGGLLLDRRAGWIKGGDRGATIVPGDVNESLLIHAVRHGDPELQMPPTERLSDEAIAKLEQWIRMGAPASEEDPNGAAGFVNPSDPVAGKTHWAWQPLVQNPAPVVSNSAWPRTKLDQFVLSRLEQEGLSPVADANPADLVRRICFQLTGLPPTRQQLHTFEAAPQPEALEHLVDELLNSSQFGQRWGRHWLDLARYADSNGLDENFLFREAWRYRNWVIDAVNADMPFDQFLLEQLAGDLLPFDSIEQRDRQRIAAGFLVVGPKVLLGINPQKQRMDVADEQLETIGRAVLAQTLGCARCHDHKFDPVPTADYYAMAGILTSTQVMEQRYMLGQQRVMERLVGLGESGEGADTAYEKYWRELETLKANAEKAKSVLEVLKQADDASIAAKLASTPDGFVEAAKDATQPAEKRILAQENYVKELAHAISNPPQIPPRAMIPADTDTPDDEKIRLAGQFDSLGEKVPRGFLQVLCDETPAAIPVKASGRIELSHWLTNPESRAGWLTARVQANRIWYHLIGRGLVRTVDNFGRTGETPSHPELLDYLAVRLIDSGWSFKAVIREIVLSHTFALSSQHDPAGHALDPENILLWQAHRRRLDPESLRDAILSAAGTLDLKPMESTVSYLGDQATAVGPNPNRRRTDFPCRSVYLPVIRNDLPEIFDVFDFANPHATTGARSKTTVPTQALFMLNDKMVMEAAEATARRILAETESASPELRINPMFELIVGSKPTDNERQAILLYLQDAELRLQTAGDQGPQLRALALACHAVFASSRFQYLE